MKKLSFTFFMFALVACGVQAMKCSVENDVSECGSCEKIKITYPEGGVECDALMLVQGALCDCVTQLNQLRLDMQKMQLQVSNMFLINEFSRIVKKRESYEPTCITASIDDIRTLRDIEDKRREVQSIFDVVEPFKQLFNRAHIGAIEKYLENTVVSPIVEKPLLHIMEASYSIGSLFDISGDLRNFARANGFGCGVWLREWWMRSDIDYHPHSAIQPIMTAFNAENSRREAENERINKENQESKEKHDSSKRLAEQYDDAHFPADELGHVVDSFNKLVYMYNNRSNIACMGL